MYILDSNPISSNLLKKEKKMNSNPINNNLLKRRERKRWIQILSVTIC